MSDIIFFGVIFVFLIGCLAAFIWAFISSQQFRSDLLAHDSSNEFTLGPLNVKGVLFLALVALFLGSTIYLFTQFLDKTEAYDFESADASNDSLIDQNNKLIKENQSLIKEVKELNEKVSELKLSLLKREAIMDIYKNTKLLAHNSILTSEESVEEDKISIISAKIGTLSELANNSGLNITHEVRSSCDNKSDCIIPKSHFPEPLPPEVEFIMEYMCSNNYKLKRISVSNENFRNISIGCKST